MIPVTPYLAEYSVLVAKPNGKHMPEWRSCKVLGATTVGDEPAYVIEIYHSGTSSLTTTDEVKRLGPGNPL
ncbi:hypothetical protein HFO04_25895 [Rhizobium laguerreae]|uniref:hypothetical protein n=1 Tax=Rhizobium laguerreae TaxID=1076926 RepID=UPI001C9012B8|nr:hypothetical protein [Rhizobium laguerreae]MBY3306175.1 hypothetical protein [Rhizobium laguerreae]